MCAYLTTFGSLMNALASRILISIRGTEAARKRGRTAAARDYRISGALDAADSPCPPSFIREHKGQCSILMPLHCARSPAHSVFLVLVIMGAAPRPAPHLRDKNLIKGASAGMLDQRNSRGTARGTAEEHHC